MVYGVRHSISSDTLLQSSWWNYIYSNGFSGISTLNYAQEGDYGLTGRGGDYTTIWYFLIYIFTKIGLYPHFPVEYNIKFITVFFVFLSAIAIFFIVKYFRPKSRYLPIVAFSIVPFLPVFLGDLVKTNLPDASYIALALFSFLAFLKNKQKAAWFLLGIAASFKLMAIYLAPVYIFFYLRDFRKYNLKDRIAPLFFLIAIVIMSLPNVLAGGTLVGGIIEPLLARTDAGNAMTLNAPNLWTILPNDERVFKVFAISLLAFAILLLYVFIFSFINKAKQKRVVYGLMPTLLFLLCAFILPKQHETYSSMAGILSLIGVVVLMNKESWLIFLSANVIGLINAGLTLHFVYKGEGRIAESLDLQIVAYITMILIIYIIFVIYKNSRLVKSQSPVMLK